MTRRIIGIVLTLIFSCSIFLYATCEDPNNPKPEVEGKTCPIVTGEDVTKGSPVPIPSRGMDINMHRYYFSQWEGTDEYSWGRRATFTYNTSLEELGDAYCPGYPYLPVYDYVKIITGTGQTYQFEYESGGWKWILIYTGECENPDPEEEEDWEGMWSFSPVLYTCITPGVHKSLVYSGTYTMTNEKDGTIEQFNTHGRLDYIEDTNGNKLTFTYDGSEPNKLLYITDQSGRQMSFTYDNYRRIHTITDGASRTYTYTYDINDNLIEEDEPLDREKTYTYDEDYNLASITDWNGNTVTYTYTEDPQGDPAIASIGDVTYSYDFPNRETTITDAEDNELYLIL